MPLQRIQVHAYVHNVVKLVHPQQSTPEGIICFGLGVPWPVSAMIDAQESIVIDVFLAMSMCLIGSEPRFRPSILFCHLLWTLSHMATQL